MITAPTPPRHPPGKSKSVGTSGEHGHVVAGYAGGLRSPARKSDSDPALPTGCWRRCKLNPRPGRKPPAEGDGQPTSRSSRPSSDKDSQMETEQTEDGTLETWTRREVAQAMVRQQDRCCLDVSQLPQEYGAERTFPGALLFCSGCRTFDAPVTCPMAARGWWFHCGSGNAVRDGGEKRVMAKPHRAARWRIWAAAWPAGRTAGQRYITTDPANGAPKQHRRRRGLNSAPAARSEPA